MTPVTVPDVPTGVAATRGNGEVLVSWTAPADTGGLPITGYVAISDPDGDTCSTTGATSCMVTGLTNGQGYTFTVLAANDVGVSDPSDPSTSVTPDAVPDPPTDVIATAGDSSASVTWSAPSDNGTIITAYTVTSSPDGWTCATTDELTCVVTDLSNGTAYTFTVTASSDAGPGLPSAPSAPITPAALPDAPTDVTAAPGNGSALVSWTAPSDNGSPITGYTVTSSPDGKTCAWTSGPLSCAVTGLTNGTAYSFTVTATNGVGTGSSSAASSKVTPATAPGAPTGVSGVRGNGSVLVSWTAPTANGGSAITSYTVTSSPGGYTCTTATPPTCTVTGLTNGTAVHLHGGGHQRRRHRATPRPRRLRPPRPPCPAPPPPWPPRRTPTPSRWCRDRPRLQRR